jgi:hypothetical protein
MLLVVIAIGFMIYFIDIMAISGNSMMPKAERPEEQPWQHEDLIRDPNQPTKINKSKAAASKPVISKFEELNCLVTAENSDRGRIAITIEPDGTLAGK